MQYILNPTKDATIYSKYNDINTGADPIIEIVKDYLDYAYTYKGEWNSSSLYLKDDYVLYSSSYYVCLFENQNIQPVTSSYWGLYDNISLNNNSRILIQFPISDVPSNVLASASSVTLKLYSCFSKDISTDFYLYAYPLSSSWSVGTGDYTTKLIKNGVSWTYKDGTINWNTSGSDYLSIYSASQYFPYGNVDINMDVKNITDLWKNNTILNYGFVIKKSNTDEYSNNRLGVLSYYGMDTHTVYVPELVFSYDDHVYNTGSLVSGSLFTGSMMDIYMKNMKSTYLYNTLNRFYIGIKPQFQRKTFYRSNMQDIIYYINDELYYSIIDTFDGRTLIPFSSHSKVSLGSDGYYFDLNLSGFMPERFYKIMFKSYIDGVYVYVDKNYSFKVVK